MDILLETTLAERKLGTHRFFTEVHDYYTWMAYSLILIAASFIVESSFSVSEDGRLSVVLGGPVSWYGLAGAVGLFLNDIRKRKHLDKTFGDKIRNNDTFFFRFTDMGVEYGIRNAWTAYFSWELITRVDVRRKSLDFAVPNGRLVVHTQHLKLEEIAALRDFFSKQREIIRPEPLFGWHRKAAGSESYGVVKDSSADKKRGHY
jgi:hypothetical protein